MPFAVRHRGTLVAAPAPVAGLAIARESDAFRMATLQGRTMEEMARRFAAGHRAYVARLDGVPAAWGWVATRVAEIGELPAAFSIPAGERYLWNFVTLPAFRGRGIYAGLLDAIVCAESSSADRFWIAWAPENRASGAGIAKAGFTTVARLSFAPTGDAALEPVCPEGAARAQRMLGLPIATQPLAPCWRCVRAGRPAMSCAPGSCRCDYQEPRSGCAV